MHSIGQNIKSLACPVSDVWSLATVDKTVTSFMDQSSPNLEHSFYASKDLFETNPYRHVNKNLGILTQNWL